MAHDVFISYSSKDKPVADAVCAALESRGVRCWIAPRDISPGAEYGESIVESITGSRSLVLVFSSNANNSPQIRREVERAVNKGVPIIPFRIEDVAPAKSLEYFIGAVHWLDAFHGPFEVHLDALFHAVERTIASHGDTHTTPMEHQDRILDAAISRRVPVGTATDLVAMVRQVDSGGLKAVLQIDEEGGAQPEDVRSKPFDLEFPVGADGRPGPAELNLRVESPDFEPKSQAKTLTVPPGGDSDICRFLLTPQRTGELLLHLEVSTRLSHVASRRLTTVAHSGEHAHTGMLLVNIPLSVCVTNTSAGRGAPAPYAYDSVGATPAVAAHKTSFWKPAIAASIVILAGLFVLRHTIMPAAHDGTDASTAGVRPSGALPSDTPTGPNSLDNQLLDASAKGDVTAIQQLLDRGADIEAKNYQGLTPLTEAAEGAKDPAAKLLLAKGAAIEAKDNNGRTALVHAVLAQDPDLVKLLLDQGAYVETTGSVGETPLMYAASGSKTEIVKLLLEKGANVHAKDKNGQTPLMYALSAGNTDAERLLKARAPTSKDSARAQP